MRFSFLLGKKKQSKNASFDNSKQEALIKQGREQFRRLMEKGLSVPVALL